MSSENEQKILEKILYSEHFPTILRVVLIQDKTAV